MHRPLSSKTDPGLAVKVMTRVKLQYDPEYIHETSKVTLGEKKLHSERGGVHQLEQARARRICR